MVPEYSRDANLVAEQALEDFLSHLNNDLQRVLRLLPPDAKARKELALVLRRWSCELDALVEGISSAPKQGCFGHSAEHGLPEKISCANPACSQTFWKWRPADPQRFCSPACVRQGHLLAGEPSKVASTHKGGGRANPGVAAANRRRWAQQREQRAHEYALRLLAEAGLAPAEQEAHGKGGPSGMAGIP